MMRPVCSRSILATARLATRNEPVRLASITSWKAWSLMRSISESRVMPALATSTCDRAPALLDGGEGRLDLLGVAHVAAHGQEALGVGAGGRRREGRPSDRWWPPGRRWPGTTRRRPRRCRGSHR